MHQLTRAPSHNRVHFLYLLITLMCIKVRLIITPQVMLTLSHVRAILEIATGMSYDVATRWLNHASSEAYFLHRVSASTLLD